MKHLDLNRLAFHRALGVTTTIGALLAFTGTGRAQSTYYSSLVLPAAAQTGAEHYLEQVTFAGGPASYTLTTFNFGVNYADVSQDAGVEVFFYTGLDTSTTSADILAPATYLGGVNGTLAAPTAAGNYTYTFTLNSPIALGKVSTVGVEIVLTTSDFTSYADGILNGRFTASAPTVGTSAGFVYNDANEDGTFTAAEKTSFGMAQANIRLALTGVVTAVPEPGTFALVGMGLTGALGLAARRRAASRNDE